MRDYTKNGETAVAESCQDGAEDRSDDRPNAAGTATTLSGYPSTLVRSVFSRVPLACYG